MPASNGTKARTTAVKRRQEHARDAKSRNERLAASDQLGVVIERPSTQNFPVVSPSQPERYAVAADRADRRSNQQKPEIDVGSCGQSTDADDARRAWHYGADHGNGFRQSQDKNRNEGESRMRSDPLDERVEKRCHLSIRPRRLVALWIMPQTAQRSRYHLSRAYQRLRISLLRDPVPRSEHPSGKPPCPNPAGLG